MMKFALMLLPLFSGLSYADDKIADKHQMVSVQDKNMAMAIEEARSTLDSFLAMSRNPPAGATGFKLKVMMSDDNGVEHFWMTPFKEVNSAFAGILANEPKVVKSVELGKFYEFRREQISDWGYERDGKQMGSFTVCALFKSMPKDDVARYKKDYGFTCEN